MEKFFVEDPAIWLYPKFVSQNDVYLEIGANTGQGLLYVNHYFRPKIIYGLEPNRRAFAMLMRATRRHSNIKVYNIALADFNGDAMMTGGGSSTVLVPMNLLTSRPKDGHQVSVRTLDDLKLELPPTVASVDCEGAELKVLGGGKKTFSNMHAIMIETHNTPEGETVQGTKEALESLGFSTQIFQTRTVDITGWREKWVVGEKRVERGQDRGDS
jgi:FkbM family methyltransferase